MSEERKAGRISIETDDDYLSLFYAPAEIDLIKRRASGQNNKEIAFARGRSPQTIKNQFVRIFDKSEWLLGERPSDATKLVTGLIREGYLVLPEE